ncbi:Alpha/beta hydrolase fold-1 [Hypoxylon sp. FL0543]|nr:Alpha/beta hydrolase fold-1 [Hypoxylon sp. FL0543]
MATQAKPIILFIHGSWHLPLHYRALIDGLRSSGFTVLAPYLVTTGYSDSIDDKTHVDATNQVRGYISPYLDQGREVVVVSHSSGGIVAGQASVGLTLEDRKAQGLRGGISSVIYIAALTDPENARYRAPFPEGWTDHKKRPMPEPLAGALLYNDVEESRVQEALRLLVWQSETTFAPDRLHAQSEVRAAKIFVVCTRDKIVPPEKQYQRAADAGATVAELECGHSPFLRDRETAQLVDIILKAAEGSVNASL